MAINITKVLDEIQTRLDDSTQTDTNLNRLISMANRIDNSGTNAITYKSTGQLPSTADSNYIGFMAYVASDNVFGDSSGRFYYASNRDSGWIPFTTLQDSDEANIALPAPSGIEGSNYGYVAGGRYAPPGSISGSNVIDKHSLVSDGNATDVGDLTAARSSSAGGKSSTHGYNMFGDNGLPSYNIRNSNTNKYAFASDGNATNVTSMTNSTPQTAINNLHSEPLVPTSLDFIYMAGGYFPTGQHNIIQKSANATDAAFTDVGDLITAHNLHSAVSSGTFGYTAGGGPATDTIQKFPFATDANATDVGNLLPAPSQGRGAGQSGQTHGYYSDWRSPPTATNVIQKWPYAADTDATDVGDLIDKRERPVGSQSETEGYVRAGATSPPPAPMPLANSIQKFPFATDANSTDVGDLTQYRMYASGSEY